MHCPLIIALSMRVVDAKGYRESRDAISQEWISLLESWNAIPILLPNVYSDIETLVSMADLVILTGGDDIVLDSDSNSVLEADEHAKERDLQEYKIIDVCINKNIPLIGVCRGMQLINYKFGGSLEVIESGKHVAVQHDVVFNDSEYSDIFGKIRNVNSYHNYGITKDTISSALNVLAVSDDEVVEALSHEKYPIVGIMWHPERNTIFSKFDKDLVMHLINRNKYREE